MFQAENISTCEMIQWKLENIGVFTSEQLAGLVEMWQKSHARLYNYYQLSAYSYFKYLQLCDSEYVSNVLIEKILCVCKYCKHNINQLKFF